jgi:hypothetical protein
VVLWEQHALLGETQQMRRGIWRHHIGPQAIQTNNHNMRGLHPSVLSLCLRSYWQARRIR